jgi:epoxyqueuosine reductase
VRPPDPPRPAVDEAYLAELAALAVPFGVRHTGVAPAAVLDRARAEILQRLADGFDDGMQFTFRNPRRSTDPQQAVPGAQAIFVAARPYLLDEPARPAGVQGRVARYAWVDHHAPLREALWAVAHRLRADGFKAVAYADDNSIVDREVAHLAGLGWFGKNANLLINGGGSWFVLGCVVTTAPLPLASALAEDGCGTCRRCLDACPTGAIVAPGVIDGGRCLSWVLQKPGVVPVELREAVGDRLYGCDDCQDVCPPTVHLGERHRSIPPDAAEPRAWVDVLRLLEVSDAEVVAAWGRWYLADRDPRWARRNALLVIGNTADPSDPRVRRVLAEYLSHHDPVLRVHAEWAAHRLGLQEPS